MHLHLLNSGLVTSISALSNILALCKCLAEQILSQTQCYIELVTCSLEKYYSFYNNSEVLSTSKLALIQFVVEQLKLMLVHKQARRYSTSIILLAFIWQTTSNSLYTKFCDFFVFPSVETLREYF